MSRSISVRDLQNICTDLRSWRDSDAPDWSRGLIGEMADLLEQIICARDVTISSDNEQMEGSMDYPKAEGDEVRPRCPSTDTFEA